MIIDKEYNEVKLSETKKDFYQIFSELLTTTKNITERWNPISTNESDPGIVLLKLLAAIGDKLNYNIDKNTLEAFMPSASQEESMRKLCDMMGYSIKYYRSAKTKLTISLQNSKDVEILNSNSQNIAVTVPIFTNIKDLDNNINFVTTDSVVLSNLTPMKEVGVIEGTAVDCTTSTGKTIINLNDLDDNRRFYLPETQIAENGIFIANVGELYSQVNWIDEWKKVDNLNTEQSGVKCWKFGFDSLKQLPYIQFPDDISAVIEDGLFIKYMRTNGINGNIAARTLATLELTDEIKKITNDIELGKDNFYITNPAAATNGRNKETIDEAYNNYKKTVGTFDTLVTCRDYANKIYQLLSSTDGNPLVSNVIVSDVRDDINYAYTLCTFNEFGIKYEDKIKDKTAIRTKEINNFDLVVYPFKRVILPDNETEYINSFKYNTSTWTEVESDLYDYKTMSHRYVEPDIGVIAAIKNYLKLSAKITTTYKVNDFEEYAIKKNIYAAIYKKFNSRNIDFGEEIPYDDILTCIETADERIKNVALDDPEIETKFLTVGGAEYSAGDATSANDYKTTYNQLALRNVLAGRIPLFEYEEEFKTRYNEAKHPSYEPIYPITPSTSTSENKIEKIKPVFTLQKSEFNNYKLEDNEVIQFRAPNFTTTLTYPAYVNYHYVGAEIAKDAEYKLKTDEFLYFNYTDSNDIEHNVYYTEGTIIRPNFVLKASQTVHDADSTHNWAKEISSSTEFKCLTKDKETERKTVSNTLGMFSLGGNEQIEIREHVEVKLDADINYIYWSLNSENNIEEGGKTFQKINFTKIKDKDEDTGESAIWAYELKENEYFYYTDRNKMDFAFFGMGSVLELHSTVEPKYSRDLSKDNVTSEEIINNGLGAAIDWQVKNYNETTTYLVIKEYQYKNFAKDDILNSLVLTNTSKTAINGDEWYQVNSATINDKALPDIHIENEKWEVRTKYEINIGPDTTQTLGNNDSIDIWYKDNTSTVTTIKNQGEDNNKVKVSIRSNYLIQKSTPGFIDLKNPAYDIEGNVEYNKYDVKIKVFKDEPLYIANAQGSHEELNVDNFGDYWTKLDLSKHGTDTTSAITSLQINLPEKCYGTVLMYYEPNIALTGTTKRAYITRAGDTSSNIFEILNKGSWWNYDDTDDVDDSSDSRYYLREGINIVLVKTKGDLNIFTNGNTEGVIVLGDLRLIKIDTDDNLIINETIDYMNSEDILAAIKNLDPDFNFYYTCPIENSTAINLNKNTDEKLSDPLSWYDYNNVNNKFVISEISVEDMKKGITLTKSSKK